MAPIIHLSPQGNHRENHRWPARPVATGTGKIFQDIILPIKNISDLPIDSYPFHWKSDPERSWKRSVDNLFHYFNPSIIGHFLITKHPHFGQVFHMWIANSACFNSATLWPHFFLVRIWSLFPSLALSLSLISLIPYDSLLFVGRIDIAGILFMHRHICVHK